jgi:hypothetical protein
MLAPPSHSPYYRNNCEVGPRKTEFGDPTILMDGELVHSRDCTNYMIQTLYLFLPLSLLLSRDLLVVGYLRKLGLAGFLFITAE